MYRVSKVLNNNGVIAIDMDENKEYVILGKGVGFGKKVSQRFDKPEGCTTYRLEQETERGSAKELVKGIEPEYLEIADAILTESQKVFGDSIDRGILFPLADHISFAVARIRRNEQISNPLTEDIRLLFYSEYKEALTVVPILKKRMGIDMDEHEVGYIALHVHTAIEKEELSQAMQIAQAVRDCVSYVENVLDKKLNVMSLSYNRLMNHVRYMVARQMSGEVLKLDMNDYMGQKFPEEFQMAAQICEKLGKDMRCQFSKVEIGYLAMHLQRILTDEELNE